LLEEGRQDQFVCHLRDVVQDGHQELVGIYVTSFVSSFVLGQGPPDKGSVYEFVNFLYIFIEKLD
jgi:hypothetical protein